jgi:hypothetical protein
MIKQRDTNELNRALKRESGNNTALRSIRPRETGNSTQEKRECSLRPRDEIDL